MADYQDIRGLRVKYLSADPSTTVDGEVWYNSTTGTLRGRVATAATSSASSMINARGQNGCAHNGTQTAALSVAGNPQPTPPFVSTNSEEYNGSGWAVGGTYPTAVFGAYGCGTQTAALIYGGRLNPPGTNVTDVTASYNGTVWAPEGALSTGRQSIGAFGATEITAIAAGGHNAPGNYVETEEYSGTAWTTVPSTYTPQDNMGAAGTSTAGITASGNPTTNTQLFDGSTWAAGPAQNTARSSLNQGLAGHTQDAVVALGGTPPANIAIESYDGSSWSTSPASLATGRSQSASSGTNTAAVLFGGTSGSYVSTVEEYNVSSNVITAAAWAAGGNYPINSGDFSGAGTQAAAIAFGGRVYPGPNAVTGVSATYDGAAWTAGPSLTTARMLAASAKNGTTTAALCTGGSEPSLSDKCEEFNGSTWAEGPNYPTTAQFGDQGVGDQGDALISGGYGGGPGSAYLDATSTYNGSTWTALAAPSNLQDSRFSATATGTSTLAVMFAGTGGAGKVESWNGSTWAEQAEALTARTAGGSAGTSTDALYYGGEGPTGVTEGWDGTSFSTRPTMGTARFSMASCGTATLALATGGFTSSNSTEEFTGVTTAANIVTLTTS